MYRNNRVIIAMSTTTIYPSGDFPINFTENAARKVKELMLEDGNDALNLRLYIQGGGCSGFQYQFKFDEEINNDDTVIEKTIVTNQSNQPEGAEEIVKLLVDPMSFQYLLGSKIDYKSDIEGEQFVISNPNAKTTCGCGSSFTVEDN